MHVSLKYQHQLKSPHWETLSSGILFAKSTLIFIIEKFSPLCPQRKLFDIMWYKKSRMHHKLISLAYNHCICKKKGWHVMFKILSGSKILGKRYFSQVAEEREGCLIFWAPNNCNFPDLTTEPMHLLTKSFEIRKWKWATYCVLVYWCLRYMKLLHFYFLHLQNKDTEKTSSESLLT